MADSQEIAISIENLTKSYPLGKKHSGNTPPKEALKNVNLTIPRGSIYGLLGPNGAGKSTLINILAGLTLKSSGKIIIDGIDIDDDPIGTRYSIGVVPQELTLDPFFSVYETLEYHGGYFGVPKNERRTMELIKTFSLSEKTHVNSRRLSGGMKRRVLIAKALVHTPPILILDEPTAGVDVDLRMQLWEYVRELNKKGTTILLTTHYLEEAENLCGHIAIINNGEIIADDDTPNLMRTLDRKQVTLKFIEELTAVPRGFEKYGVQLLDKHTLQINYRTSEASIADFMPLIKRAELNLLDIMTKEPDLEDIFRFLVRKENSV